MSDPTQDLDEGTHEPDEAGHGHGGHDEQDGHRPTKGPVDWLAWAAGLLGVGAGLAVAFCLYASTSL